MSDNDQMQKMIAQIMDGYDENPKKAAWKRKFIKGILAAVILAVAFQIIYGGVLYVLAKQGEGKLQTASSYAAIEKNFKRINKQQKKLIKRIEFYENPFQGKYYFSYGGTNLGSLMMSQASSGSSGDSLTLLENNGVNSADVQLMPESESSKTNVEEEGIAEADEVIADNGYIYALHTPGDFHGDHMDTKGKWVYILKPGANGCEQIGKMRVSWVDDGGGTDGEECGLYVWKNTLIAVKNRVSGAMIISYDISNPAAPVKNEEIAQSGTYALSRMVEGRLVVVSRMLQGDAGANDSDEEDGDFKPYVNEEEIPAKDIYMQRDLYAPALTVIATYDTEGDGTIRVVDKKAVVGDGGRIYMKGNHLYILNHVIPKLFDKTDRTGITKLELDEKGKITGTAHRVVEGWIGEGFAVKEQNGHLRLCMSVRHYDSQWRWKKVEVPFGWYLGEYYSSQLKMTAEMYQQTIAASGIDESSRDISVMVLDENLEDIGQAKGLYEGDQIQTARFVGNYLYAVGEEKNTLLQINMATEELPALMDSIQTMGDITYLHPLGEDNDTMIALGKDVSGELILTFYKTVAGKGMEQMETYPLVQRTSDAMSKYTKILIQETEDGCYLGFATKNADGLQYPLIYYQENQGVETVLRSETNNRGDRWCRGLFMEGRFYVLRDSGLNLQVEGYETGTFRQTGVWHSEY